MNIIFHTAAAISVTALLTDTNRLEHTNASKHIILTAVVAFVVGLISHAALDYIPHCYPINSKIDVAFGLAIILTLIYFSKKKYRIITALSFVGTIFPDLVDLSLPIINKQLGLTLPTFNKVFPWHWREYSGSIYSGQCSISTLNHFLLLVAIAIICWGRRTDLKTIFEKRNSKQQLID
ncbi:MAG: hypothetical protein R2798_11705 [Chitinophagales bacterium]|nr:hypothetical protein [Bacteroidota bacterium]MCB9042576.1 hypothetical protein [Chitinophagales bacterium]